MVCVFFCVSFFFLFFSFFLSFFFFFFFFSYFFFFFFLHLCTWGWRLTLLVSSLGVLSVIWGGLSLLASPDENPFPAFFTFPQWVPFRCVFLLRSAFAVFLSLKPSSPPPGLPPPFDFWSLWRDYFIVSETSLVPVFRSRSISEEFLCTHSHDLHSLILYCWIFWLQLGKSFCQRSSYLKRLIGSVNRGVVPPFRARHDTVASWRDCQP